MKYLTIILLAPCIAYGASNQRDEDPILPRYTIVQSIPVEEPRRVVRQIPAAVIMPHIERTICKAIAIMITWYFLHKMFNERI